MQSVCESVCVHCRQSSLCCATVSVSTTHNPSALECFPSLPVPRSPRSGLDKSLPTNYIMGPASKRITHGADRRIIAPVCHTLLGLPAEKLQRQETAGRRGRLGAGGAPQTAVIDGKCGSVRLEGEDDVRELFPEFMISLKRIESITETFTFF